MEHGLECNRVCIFCGMYAVVKFDVSNVGVVFSLHCCTADLFLIEVVNQRRHY